MRVSPISASLKNKPKTNFKSMTFDESTSASLKKFTTGQLSQVIQWQEELEDTKYFDMHVAQNGYKGGFSIEFHDKSGNEKHSLGPIFHSHVNGKELTVAVDDLKDDIATLSYDLKFESNETATNWKNKLESAKVNSKWRVDQFRLLAWAVESIKCLEEGNGNKMSDSASQEVTRQSLIDKIIHSPKK